MEANQLTIYDLLIEYLTIKLKENISSSVTLDEFIDFLKDYNKFYEPIIDPALINWKDIIDNLSYKNEIDIICMDGKLVFKANYNLTTDTSNNITIRFMSKFDKCILDIKIDDLLSYEKSDNYLYDSEDENVNSLSALLTAKIFERDIKLKIADGKWPKYTYDIKRFLFNTNLSLLLGLTNDKSKYMNLYKRINSLIGYMNYDDDNLKISNISNSYLASYNYNKLVDGIAELKDILNSVGFSADLKNGRVTIIDLRTGDILEEVKLASENQSTLSKKFLENIN